MTVPYMTFSDDTYYNLGRFIMFRKDSFDDFNWVMWYDDASNVPNPLPNKDTIKASNTADFIRDVLDPLGDAQNFREAQMHKVTTYSDWFGDTGRTGVTVRKECTSYRADSSFTCAS